jgi:alkylation response protein AidB-like acyl-CoA dehydrogenase
MNTGTTPSTTSSDGSGQPGLSRRDWRASVADLGPGFSARADAHDADDSFVVENYRELKEYRLFSAAVPTELGGGGATHRELCALLRELARQCGSTALALSMHTHLVATTVWRYQQGHAVGPLLQRICAEQLVLVSTGASDWLDSSGVCHRVDRGYRVSGRKIFCSGSPDGDLLMTSAPYDDPEAGPTVLHFPVPMRAPGVVVLDNWRAMGMRATGSNDVLLQDVFVPESAIVLRRPQGKWHPFFAAVHIIAMPLVMSVYVGIAEAARDLALQSVQRKREDPDMWSLVGEMDNALATAQMAVQAMIDLCADYRFEPDVATASAIFVRKTIAAQALIATVEKALEVVGGGGLFRAVGLERLLRDIHGVQFHPLQAKRQHRFTGRVALGLDPIG